MINHELETGVTESARRINDQELREFGDNAPFVCLFSGGKDSGLAISIAQDFARPMALIYYIHYGDRTYDHALRLKNVTRCADAMSIPLEVYEGGRKEVKDLHKFAKVLAKYAARGARYLVSGSIYDLGAYKINKGIADIVGMEFKAPLWNLTNEEIMDSIEKRNLKSVITWVDTEYVPEEYLGKILDRDFYNDLKSRGRNPFCDDSDYDTTLLDSDRFVDKLSYHILEKTDGAGIEIELTDP